MALGKLKPNALIFSLKVGSREQILRKCKTGSQSIYIYVYHNHKLDIQVIMKSGRIERQGFIVEKDNALNDFLNIEYI